MCAQISDLFTTIPDKKDDSSFNLKDAINKYLYHWPLFLIGLTITLSAAFMYLRIAGTKYEVYATILIKDKGKTPDDKSILEKLDITSTPKLAESEVEVFKSRSLISQVVNDLQLWTTYQFKDGLNTIDLYKSSPVVFRLLDSTGYFDGATFKIKIKDKNSFLLEHADGTAKQFLFANSLENNFGTWKLDTTGNIEQFIGQEITIVVNDPNKIAQAYQKWIDASIPNKLSPIIMLSVTDKIQQRGKDILNDLIRNYKKNDVAQKNEITQNTLDFINKRIGLIAGELNNSEKDLENYRSSKGVTDISQQSQTYLDNIKNNDEKLNEINVQLNIIEGIERNLNSSQNIQSASASLINYPSLNGLIQTLAELQLKRDNLLATVPESNPMYEPLNRQIRATKNDVRDNIKNIKTGLLDAKTKLEAIGSKFESTIRNIPSQERGLIDKTRQQNVKENLYTYLLQKREEISMSYASPLSDAQIVDYAYSSLSSKKPMIYGIAFLIGLMLPAGLIYGRSNFTNRIINRKEIENATGSPLFGELMYARSSTGLIANDAKNIAIGEEFRSLRTNLHFLKKQPDEGIVILLTSSISNEGKSYISSNLGYVLAVSGKKTVVLEMDLRKPRISGIFNLPEHAGITDYLTNSVQAEAVIQNSNVHANLDVIGSGPLPSEPSEILGQPEVDVLIQWLRSKYDYVIVDSPPVNLVTDAKILSRVADVTLYVIRQGYTYKSLLSYIKAMVKEQRFPDIRFILNGVQKGRYEYGYNYGNEYYQGLGKSKRSIKILGFTDFFKRF